MTDVSWQMMARLAMDVHEWDELAATMQVFLRELDRFTPIVRLAESRASSFEEPVSGIEFVVSHC